MEIDLTLISEYLKEKRNPDVRDHQKLATKGFSYSDLNALNLGLQKLKVPYDLFC